MNITRLLGATALASSIFVAPLAFAQTTAPADSPSQAAATGTQAILQDDSAESPATSAGDVVVTGSRIRSPNLESALPITSLRGEEVFQQAQTNLGETLNDLPQLRSTFSQQNPGLGIGVAGLNLLDLRGLGPVRTLVLVNGRRHVGADILSSASAPDVNTIPLDLIERTDVVTGSNSAVYGSDAIAGVVNFVLRRDYDGLQLRGNAGTSEKGFGGNQYVSALAGHNFSEGRGNVTAHLEYSNQKRIYASDIDFLRRQDGFGVVDADPAGLTGNSDGFPDRIFIRDIRSASIHRYGLVPITYTSTNARCGIGIAPTNGAPANTGNPYNCTYIFGQNGQLTPQTGTRYGTGIIGGITGGNGQTGREEKLVSILPQIERINANILAHYTFDEAFEAFFEGKVTRINSQGSAAGPSFIQGTFGQYDIRERTRLDNPFLSATDRATIASQILASGCNPSLTAPCSLARSTFGGQGIQGALNAADIAAINAGTYRFVTSRTLADSGLRDERFQRDTYRFVGGLRGTFNEDWSYEIAANYGKFEERTTTFGYTDRQRFLLSLDAGRNPATGQIQCRAQFDPASAVAFPNNAANQARLAADIAACVPYNPFGGADNTAASNYFVYNARHRASLEQLDFTGFVSGDLSQLFELPGGPIGFAIGGEYRREKARYFQDDFVLTGATNAVVIPDFAPPSFEVKEAYGELRVPLLKDTPFFETLTLSGAGRVSDYKGSAGTVWTYNGGIEWAPIRDIRFRGNYGRAVRAPNLSETGFPVVPNFAPGFVDPCSPNSIGSGTQFRAANCATDLGGLLASIPNRTYSLPILSGSNTDLAPERSNSFTIGGVLQPRFLPGFSLSVDYFNIKVKGVITSLSAQAIVNGCYDQPTLDNPLCATFVRFRGPGTGPLNETPGDVLGNSLNAAPFNFAKRIRRGLDIEAAYRTNVTDDVRFDTRFIMTHQFQNSNYQNPTDPNFENRLLSELGDPKNEFRWDASVTAGPLTLGYQLRYIGPMFLNAYEDFNALQDRGPQDADYADVQTYPSVLYNDIRLEYVLNNAGPIGKQFSFFFGVDNFTNTKPPLGSTATGAGSAIYQVRGRQFFSGFRARF